MSTCPECNTRQTRDAPYCESCGYRMRRVETMREGVQAVDPTMLADYLQNGGREPADSSKTIKQMPALDRATVQETPAIDPRLLAEARRSQQPSEKKGGDPSTLVEGLRRVDFEGDFRDVEHAGLEEATGPEMVAVAERPIERSGLYADPISPGRSRLVLFIALWFAVTAVGILIVYFVMDRRTAKEATWSESAAAPSEKILIDGGPFRSGLTEEVRSFILQSCFRAHDDPDEACQQDKLLKGEFPDKTIDVPPFRIDSKEVTVDLYEKCVSSGTCSAIDYRECAVWTPQGLQISLRVPRALRESGVPVVCVTRAQAESYCGWVGGGLPTGDQWEKAARGTGESLFPWGDVWSSDKANWGEADVTRTFVVGKLDGFEWTAPPGSFPEGASPYGVYDMAGNVSEWVKAEDSLIGYARGGSWISNPFEMRVTARLELKADAARTDVGFRCAYPVPL